MFKKSADFDMSGPETHLLIHCPHAPHMSHSHLDCGISYARIISKVLHF